MSLISERPNLSAEIASREFHLTYDLVPVDCRLLDGERDQNWQITLADGTVYVFKVCNATTPHDLVDAYTAAFKQLDNVGDFVPHLLPAREGRDFGMIEYSGQEFRVRALTWLPGIPLAKVNRPSSYLLEDLGRKLGQIDVGLQSLDFDVLRRPFEWNLVDGIEVIRKHAKLISQTTLRDTVHKLADRIESNLASQTRLRKSTIHNDANDYNVIVSTDRDEFGERTVCGIIDFGDLAWSYIAAEPAIALAYIVCRHPDFLTASCDLLRGYHASLPLQRDEIAVVFDLILLRLCVSVCMSAKQLVERPDDPYLAISQKPIHATLPKLASLDAAVVTETLLVACGFCSTVSRSGLPADICRQVESVERYTPETTRTAELKKCARRIRMGPESSHVLSRAVGNRPWRNAVFVRPGWP